eukprot:5254724-Amphidinium_carterae.1
MELRLTFACFYEVKDILERTSMTTEDLTVNLLSVQRRYHWDTPTFYLMQCTYRFLQFDRQYIMLPTGIYAPSKGGSGSTCLLL